MSSVTSLPFVVPSSLRDLENPPQQEDRLYARKVIDVDTLASDEVDELVKGVAFDLADKEVLCIEEQDVFDQVYSLVRDFSSMEPSAKSNLIESLCSNFSVLLPNITSLMKSVRDSSGDAASLRDNIHSHRNAFKIYAYFLQCILATEESGAETPTGRPTLRTGGKSKQTRKKHVCSWNWELQRMRIVRLLAVALESDLGLLFGVTQPEESLLAFISKGAFTMLENPALSKYKDVTEALCNIISACSTKYHYTVQSTTNILHLLHKHEHLALYLAETVASAEQKYQDGSLALALLREIGLSNPKDYARDGTAADNVGKFLVEMADHLPKLVATNVGILMTHFGGESYKIRSALVSVLGKLISKGFKDGDGNACSEISRLRNKQSMIDVLLERSRDTSAYTRSRVLQTWADLCEQRALSIGLWNQVADMAAGRLEDKTAIVRKSALHLLATLLQYNPFGPQLRTAAFEATLEKYKKQLNGMSSDSSREHQNLEETNKDLRTAPEGAGMDASIEDELSQTISNDGTELQENKEDSGPSQPESEPKNIDYTFDVGGVEQTRALVASLESGLHFAKCMASIMPVLVQLLASSTASDVEHTIQLLMCARQFNVDGAESALQKMLPLVFSQERGVNVSVENAFVSIYIRKSSLETAYNLINLTLEASIGDLASMEVLVGNLVKKGEISQSILLALWDFFTFNAPGVTPEQSRGALVVLCMAAKSSPKILNSHLQNVVDIGFGRWAKEDMLLARTACIALQQLSDEDRLNLLSHHKIFNNLASLITASGLPEESWYAAAEQAINTIYTLHPMPEVFSANILHKFYSSVIAKADLGLKSVTASDNGSDCTADKASSGYSIVVTSLSRFLFLVGHIALKHLVYVESCVKKIRKQRFDKERAAAESQDAAQAADPVEPIEKIPKEENINAELGVAALEDVKIDSLQEQTEREIVSGVQNRKFLIGSCAPTVVKICKNFTLLQQFPNLRSSAMLALCKLMVLDANFCDANLQLLFTAAQNAAEDHVRSNCIIALGDLAVRFPNLLEPWTEHFYARLHDSSQSVRKNAVLVLSHLILNDMMKVKGHISELALRLEDEDSRIASLVKLFFHELSKKGNNPIYNLLPDILSQLSSMQNLSQELFCSIMQFLIGFIKQDKQMEGLIEKLCNRFLGTTDSKRWRDIVYCLSQLTYTEKGIKKLADLFKNYQHTLAEDEVMNHFRAIISKARKLAKPDVKALVDELEEKLINCHKEKKEQEITMRNAQAHVQEQVANVQNEIQYSDDPNIVSTTSNEEHDYTHTVEETKTIDPLDQIEATSMDGGNVRKQEDNMMISPTSLGSTSCTVESTVMGNVLRICKEEDDADMVENRGDAVKDMASACQIEACKMSDFNDVGRGITSSEDIQEGPEGCVTDDEKENIDKAQTLSPPVTSRCSKTKVQKPIKDDEIEIVRDQIPLSSATRSSHKTRNAQKYKETKLRKR